MTTPNLSPKDVAELREAVETAVDRHDAFGPIGKVIGITLAGQAKLIAALAIASQSAALEAALKQALHILCDKQENGRPQPASIRASMARVIVESALAGKTSALDDFVKDALASQSLEREGEIARLRADLATYVTTTEAIENKFIDTEFAAYEREGEIRRAAIEECIRFIQGYPRYTDAICHALRVLAQQPPDGDTTILGGR